MHAQAKRTSAQPQRIGQAGILLNLAGMGRLCEDCLALTLKRKLQGPFESVYARHKFGWTILAVRI
jgi:hypothetical protein